MTKYFYKIRRRESSWLPRMFMYNINSIRNEEELEPSVVDCHHDSTAIIPSGRVASVMESLEQGSFRKEAG